MSAAKRVARRQCQIHVAQRHYSQPGQCEKKLGLRRIQVGDTPVLACKPHRDIITRGRVLPVVTRRKK